MSTFSTAITGLKAYQTDLGVIGNNIANAAQRGYEANAKLITVADQVQQTTLNLLR